MKKKVKKKIKKRSKVVQYLTNTRYLLIIFIFLLIFHNYLTQITLIVILMILGIISVRATTFVPHISIETISASSILIGYVWGWKFGLIFGVSAGLIAAIYNSFLKLTTIINALLMGLCGILGALFASLNYSFFWAFLLTYLIRSNLGFAIYQTVKPNLTENILHSYGDALYNVLIVYHFMFVLYRIIVAIG